MKPEAQIVCAKQQVEDQSTMLSIIGWKDGSIKKLLGGRGISALNPVQQAVVQQSVSVMPTISGSKSASSRRVQNEASAATAEFGLESQKALVRQVLYAPVGPPAPPPLLDGRSRDAVVVERSLLYTYMFDCATQRLSAFGLNSTTSRGKASQVPLHILITIGG